MMTDKPDALGKWFVLNSSIKTASPRAFAR